MLSRLAPTLSIEPLASRTLAKSLAFPDSVKDVSIVREGKRRVIVPSNAVWDGFLIALASTFPHAINQPFRIANRPDAAASCRYSCDARARRSNDWRGDILDLRPRAQLRALIVVTGNRGEFDRVPSLQ
jgi:virulence-associated protein VagC